MKFYYSHKKRALLFFYACFVHVRAEGFARRRSSSIASPPTVHAPYVPFLMRPSAAVISLYRSSRTLLMPRFVSNSSTSSAMSLLSDGSTLRSGYVVSQSFWFLGFLVLIEESVASSSCFSFNSFSSNSFVSIYTNSISGSTGRQPDVRLLREDPFPMSR